MVRQTYTSTRSLQARSPSRFRSRSTQSNSPSPVSQHPTSGQPAPSKLHSGLHPGIGLAAIVTTVGLAGAITLPGSPLHLSQLLPSPAAPTPSPVDTLVTSPSKTGLSPEAVYRKASAAVVTIDTPKRSTGSGVFINRSGTLLTNEHVVEQFSTVQVTLFNRQRVTGRVIQVDQTNDLAVVQIDSSTPSSCLPISPEALKIGQIIYALGSPLGMQQTFTNGVVSRHAETGEVFHTAAIAPGSSGSPLLNEQGRIVGINRAVLTEFEAMSIAVPPRAIHQLEISLDCHD